MALNRSHQMMSALGEFRFQPTEKRLRVERNGSLIAQTRRAALVWEPRRIVPSYAIPAADFAVDVGPSSAAEAVEHPVRLGEGPSALDPRTKFGFHTAAGQAMSVGSAAGVGFQPSDPDLGEMLVLDFDAFDWFEEDEPIFGHPRDPFSRIDLRHSRRHLRIELEGVVLAESEAPLMLFESVYPARYYLDRSAIRVELRPGSKRSVCAYKGHASHWSVDLEGGANVAWSYETPPPEVGQITGLVCFYQEHVDFIVDGQRLERPRTPWS